MLTITLAIIHKYGKNDKFNPSFLYIGTVFLDILLIDSLNKIFGK